MALEDNNCSTNNKDSEIKNTRYVGNCTVINYSWIVTEINSQWSLKLSWNT